MADHSNHHSNPGEIPPPQTKEIWKIFWYLAAITGVEFVIAFTLPASGSRVAIFIILTLVKAFLIVAHFMHLKHEVKVLIWSIVLPLIFVVWLVVALLLEGSAILIVR